MFGEERLEFIGSRSFWNKVENEHTVSQVLLCEFADPDTPTLAVFMTANQRDSAFSLNNMQSYENKPAKRQKWVKQLWILSNALKKPNKPKVLHKGGVWPIF